MEYSLKSQISGAIRIAEFENQNWLKDTFTQEYVALQTMNTFVF